MVVVGRTSRSMVVVAILVAARNFEMFIIPYCDFSVAVQSVSSLSALAQLVGYCGRSMVAEHSPWSRCYCTRSAVDLRSQCGRTTELRRYRDYTVCTATKRD